MNTNSLLTKGTRLAVLGGCGGIGRHLVRSALECNAQVAVLDLAQSFDKHPVPNGVLSYTIDATNEEDIRTAFTSLEAQWEGLDGFVNFCGYMHDNQPIAEMPSAIFDDIIQGNLRSAFSAAQHAMPLLQRAGDNSDENGSTNASSMVNVASGLAQFIRPGFGAYAAAKSAVIALTKTLALENAPTVRVNAVAPGAVDTAFLRGGTGRSNEDEPLHLDPTVYTQTIPLQRIAVPEDVTGPVKFLLGPASQYMTGQVLWINGGAYMP